MTMLERLFGFLSSGPVSAPPDVPALPDNNARRDSIVNPLTGLGGAGDKGAAGYSDLYRLDLGDAELRALYSHNGIVRRIVDLVPGRATRRGWTLPDIPAAEERRLKTWARVREAMCMGRLYGGSLLVMVTEDDIPPAFRSTPQEWLAQPLDPKRVGKLHALQVFDAWEARPTAWESDLRNPGYRMPRLWSVASEGFSGSVHASRVVHFRGARRPPSDVRINYMPDASVLQAVWDEIRRLTQTMQGGAVLAAELRESVLKVSGLANRLAGDEGSALQERLTLMNRTKAVLGMILIGEQDEYENRGNPPTGFGELSEAALTMLGTVLGWPRTMLTGEAPGGLSTDDESGHQRERQIVSDFQESHREELEQLYSVVYAAQDGPTGGVVPEEWALQFSPLDEPTELEVARLRKVVAETDAIYLGEGVYGPEDVARSRFGDEGFAFDLETVAIPDPDDEDAIDAARARMEAAEAEPDPTERDDAAEGSVCILVPAADPGLLGEVQQAIGQMLHVEDEPHVTVLYLGKVAQEAVGEVVAAVQEVADTATPSLLEEGLLRAFPHGPNGTPIILEFEGDWSLLTSHERLLRKLAHLVSARQHDRYRAHLTIGYARKPLDAEALAALAAVDASEVRVPVGVLQVSVGGEGVAAVQVTG